MNLNMFTESRRLFIGTLGIISLTILGFCGKINDSGQWIATIAISVAVSNAYQKRGAYGQQGYNKQIGPNNPDTSENERNSSKTGS